MPFVDVSRAYLFLLVLPKIQSTFAGDEPLRCVTLVQYVSINQDKVIHNLCRQIVVTRSAVCPPGNSNCNGMHENPPISEQDG